MSTTPYRRTTSGIRQENENEQTKPTNQPIRTTTTTSSTPLQHPSNPSDSSLSTSNQKKPTQQIGQLYTPLVTPFSASIGGTRSSTTVNTPIALPPLSTPTSTPLITRTPSLGQGTVNLLSRPPLSARQPPGSLSILQRQFTSPTVVEEDESNTSPLSSRRPTPLQIPASVPSTPLPPSRQMSMPQSRTVPSSAQVNISAPTSTIKSSVGDSSNEPSLTENARRSSGSSNDNSLNERKPPLARTQTIPVLNSQQQQLPPLKPVNGPLTTNLSGPPMPMPYPMPFPPNAFPFGPGPNGQFPQYAYPIPVNIVSYNGAPFPGMPQPPMQQQPISQPLNKPAPSPSTSGATLPPGAIPTSPAAQTNPPPLAAPTTSLASSNKPPSSPPRPISPSMDEIPNVDKLRTLDSKPTLTELEFAAAKRAERDLTMLCLWLLCALSMVTLAFHGHRFLYDKVLYSPFANAGLGLCIIGFILILVPILLIFFGRTIYEHLPMALLFHALLSQLGSFILYIPILASYLPRSSDTALLVELSFLSARFSGSSSITAALILHALTLGLFYVVMLRILYGERREDEGITSAERLELHAALLTVQGINDERRRFQDQVKGMQRNIQSLEDDKYDLEQEKNRDRIAWEQRLKNVIEEKDQLTAIMDGLEGTKDLDSRQSVLFQERMAHINKNHEMEIKKLVSEAESRQQFGLTLQKELAMTQDALLNEKKRVKALETELEIIKLQMSSQGLEQSRLIGLQERFDILQEDHSKTFQALQRAEAKILTLDKGGCGNCSDMQEKYEHVRNQLLGQSKLSDENATLKLAINTLKQQLLGLHKRNLQLEQRTQKKVQQIHSDLHDFDQFTKEIQEEE